MLVTLVGYDIMSDRALLMPTSASDYAHVIAACFTILATSEASSTEMMPMDT
jgi:hypothetical protein